VENESPSGRPLVDLPSHRADGNAAAFTCPGACGRVDGREPS